MQRDVAGGVKRHEENATLPFRLNSSRVLFTTGGIDGEVTCQGAQHDTAAIGRGQTRLRTHGSKRQRISLDQVDAASTGVGAQSVYLCFNGVRTIPQHPDPMTRKEF